jgi:hypothetical protein
LCQEYEVERRVALGNIVKEGYGMGKSGNVVKRKFEREHFFTFELAMWLDPEFYSN